MTVRQNALWNCKNPHQGIEQKILCVCSAGLLRSPTVAWILGNSGYNTRSCGIHDYALIQIDDVLVEWADEIIFVSREVWESCNLELDEEKTVILDIPDIFAFKDPELIKIARQQLNDKGFIVNELE